jgi:hypothetical protein
MRIYTIKWTEPSNPIKSSSDLVIEILEDTTAQELLLITASGELMGASGSNEVNDSE